MPQRSGDLVFEYRVEGCAPKTLDCFDWIAKHKRPLWVQFDGARDIDGDGAIEVSAGVTASSRIRQTRLSAIWVFPEGTKIDKPESVFGGAMKNKCIRLIDVGATPGAGLDQSELRQERRELRPDAARLRRDDPAGRDQDLLASRAADPSPRAGEHGLYRSCLSRRFARRSGAAVRAGESQGAPRTRSASGRAAGRRLLGGLLGPGGKVQSSRSSPNNIFLSRLATRAILEVNLNKELSYNVCSPFFYFDQSYRDGCYVILPGTWPECTITRNDCCASTARM